MTGEIEFNGDHDWFAVELKAAKAYRIDLEGSWTGHGNLRDPYLRGVHDANGVLIPGTTNDDDTGLNSRVEFTPDDAGTYYVAAGAFWIRARHLHAVGGRGPVTCAAAFAGPLRAASRGRPCR